MVFVIGGATLLAFYEGFRSRIGSFFALRHDEPLITAAAGKANVPIVIIAGGELQSARGVDVYCEAEGQQVKIIEMLPEGSQLKIGDVVMRLDPSEIRDRLAQQQIKVTQVEALAKAATEEMKIQQNLGETNIAKARLALTLAQLDRKKYLNGDYGVEQSDLRGSIALAEAALQDARDMLDYYQTLVKKGFRTPEQLRAKEQEVKRAEYLLNRDQEKLNVLENFTRERQATELNAKAEEAEREVERAKSSSAAVVAKAQTDVEVAEATARLEREQLQRIQHQLESCDVRATAEGTLVYANLQGTRIALGEVVHYKQKLFSVPDMTQMQVNAYVHEAEVKKIKEGMEVDIRVDAFANVPIKGSVVDVANFYDPTREWISGGVKDYQTTIKIPALPADIALKPGMTAEVKIIAGRLSRGLVVPVPAVAQNDGKYYCFVVDKQHSIKRREVTIGANTESLVEVLSGLNEGDQVALDARHRIENQAFTEEPESAIERTRDVAAR